MKDENSIKPSALKQQETAFSVSSDQWWTEGKVKSTTPKKNQAFLIKFGIVVILMVIIILIALISSTTNKKSTDHDPFKMDLAQEEVGQQELTLLQQQIKDLRQQLNDADPTIKDSPFPNLDLEITIDQPQKR